MKVKVKSLSRVRLFVTLWTVAHQAPPSMGFSRQEYWSGLPFPSPGDLPYPGIESRSPALQADALTSQLPGKFYCIYYFTYLLYTLFIPVYFCKNWGSDMIRWRPFFFLKKKFTELSVKLFLKNNQKSSLDNQSLFMNSAQIYQVANICKPWF